MPTEYYGSECWIGLGEESTWGTAATIINYYDIMRSTLKPDKVDGVTRGLRGLEPAEYFDGMVMCRGEVEMEFWYQGFLKWFKHLFGNTSTTTIEAGAYRHEFVRQAALPTGLTIEQNHDDENFLFVGLKVGQAVFTYRPKENALMNFSLGGKYGYENVSPSTVTDASFPDEKLILPSHCVITLGAAGEFDFSEYCTELRVTVGNSMDLERPCFGSVYPKSGVRSGSKPDATIDLTMEYNDETHSIVQAFLAGQNQYFKAKFTSDETIVAGQYYTHMWEAPDARLVGGANFPEIAESGVQTISVQLRPVSAAAGDFEYSGLAGGLKATFHNGSSAITAAGA